MELLSSLGRFEFSPDLLELLAQQVKSGLPDGYELGSSSHPAEPYVMMFGSMGHLICGFLDEDLTKVLFIQGGISKLLDVLSTSSLFKFFYDIFIQDVAEYLLPIFASQVRRCENPATLEIMATKAVEVYGSVASWRPSLVWGLGLVPAGLSPQTFSK